TLLFHQDRFNRHARGERVPEGPNVKFPFGAGTTGTETYNHAIHNVSQVNPYKRPKPRLFCKLVKMRSLRLFSQDHHDGRERCFWSDCHRCSVTGDCDPYDQLLILCIWPHSIVPKRLKNVENKVYFT